MIKIIMHGCNGHMGQVISDIVAQDSECTMAAGIDINPDAVQNSYPVFTSLKDCDVKADVVIDFSTAKAVDGLLEDCIAKNLPLILCTTGLSTEQLDKVTAASEKIPVLRSANMSLGVNTILKLVAAAADVLARAGYDMEIVEKHHNKKVDAPSGTALALADAMNAVLNNEYSYKYDRSQERVKRSEKEIGISAVRGGNIVGEHEVFFCGQDEVIEIKHTAYSKAIFGKGAVQAAKFLAGQTPGYYNMSNVIG
ncbi:MAG: 4-hydroxy-tetrahydrodipicolinate reductase [Lachnospiraceae bacterium]|nr:4-hydroxy-tetrahydrodipicolinate reductase [Lachnospiraceae bacterium]